MGGYKAINSVTICGGGLSETYTSYYVLLWLNGSLYVQTINFLLDISFASLAEPNLAHSALCKVINGEDANRLSNFGISIYDTSVVMIIHP